MKSITITSDLNHEVFVIIIEVSASGKLDLTSLECSDSELTRNIPKAERAWMLH